MNVNAEYQFCHHEGLIHQERRGFFKDMSGISARGMLFVDSGHPRPSKIVLQRTFRVSYGAESYVI